MLMWKKVNYLLKKFYLPENFKVKGEFGGKINLIRINKFSSENFVKFCKNRNMKATGLLTALIIKSLKELYSENNLEFPDFVSYGIPISLRLRYTPNLNFYDMTHHTTGGASQIDNLSMKCFDNFETICQIADEVNHKIETDISNGKIFKSFTYNQELLTKSTESFRKLLKDENYLNENLIEEFRKIADRSNDCVISNTGPWISKRIRLLNEPLKFEELYFSDILSSTPDVYQALAFYINFFNSEIQILIAANRYAIGSKYSDRLAEILDRNINEFSNKFL